MEPIIPTEVQLDEVVTTPVEKKVKSAKKKKAKKVYEAIKVMNCARCGRETAHTLFDYDNKVYKCNICGNIHTSKRN